MYRPLVALESIAAFLVVGAASADVVKQPGVIQEAPMITTFETWGGPEEEHNMEGIEVTAHFASADSETKSWTGGPFPDPGGGVEGDDGDWSLRNLTPPPNHTFSSPWELSYNAGAGGKGNLVGLEIDGFGKFVNTGEIEGNTAFDTTYPMTGTPGSENGRDLNVIGNTHDVTATYSDAIKLAAEPAPEGDLYRRLRVDFKGRVDTKWRQPPVDQTGENIHSDIDWRLATTANGDSQAAADDFISDGRPITGVRWWGSYFNENDQPQPDPMNQNLVPAVEEGYVISFFEGAPNTPGPGRLLGMYAAPAEAVDIQPAGMVGLDEHRVWEYAVDLDQALLEHASDIATEEAFLEEAGTEYWVSIAAEDGQAINPETGETTATDDPTRVDPWWGWHTTPEAVDVDGFNDEAPYAARVLMPDDEWVYEPWEVVQQMHSDPDGFNNFAFELLTTDPASIGLDGVNDTMMSFYADSDTVVVPEPATLGGLLAGAAIVAAARGRRRRK